LIGVALSVVGGIYLASRGILRAEYLFPVVVVLLILGVVFPRSKFSSFLIFSTIAGTAALRLLVMDASLARASVHQLQPNLPLSGAKVVGRVCGTPKYYAFKSGKRGMWIFPLRLEGLNESGEWMTRCGEIDVRVMGAQESNPSALYGQRVWLQGELQRRNYRGGNSIGMKVAWPRYCVPLSSPRFSIMQWCQQWRETAGRRLDEGLAGQPVQLAVLRSLTLGYRNEVPAETYACFKRTGSLHIFAISGLHVGIIGLLLIIVLKTIGVPRDWFGVWLIPLLLIYVAATGMKASALRAMLMAAVFLLAPLFRRKPDIPSSVAFASMVLLLLNPRELLSAGFVFSFVVVAFIVMVYSVVPKHWNRGGWLKCYALSLVITSVAANLASMPMTAYYFGRFSPIALVANLVVVPLTFFVVLSGWLSILILPASVIFNSAAVAFISLMLTCVEWLDRLPGSSWAVSPPPIVSIILWYGSLIYILTHASRRRQRYYALGVASVAVLYALIC
jgi:ComEC/Rec2-related protein